MNISNSFRCVFMAFCSAVVSLRAAERSPAQQAFEYFTDSSRRASFPVFFEGDGERLAIIRGNLEEVKKLMIPALSKGSEIDQANARALFSVLPQATKLEILREVIKSYSITDSDYPYGMSLVNLGEAQDLAIMRERLRRFPPDDPHVTGMTAYMAEVDNPAAHATLVELAAIMPGAWMNDPAVKKVLDRLGGPKTHTSTSSNQQASDALANPLAGAKSPAPGTNAPASVADSRWLWGLGGLAAIAVVVFALRRRAKG